MHMVISNAVAGDPYHVDVLFMYMANMAWNSSMNTRGVMEMLTEKNSDTGEYKIPKLIYSDAYSSEMVAYADLILPDTTYLERHDAISLLDRPICEADAVADAIRWPVFPPDRDVRGFQSVLIDLGARLGLPGMVDDDGSPKYADYEDYIINHEREPVLARSLGLEGMVKNQVAVNLILGRLKHTKPMERFGTKIFQRKVDTIKWRIWHTKNLPLKWVSMTQLSHTLSKFIVRRCKNFT